MQRKAAVMRGLVQVGVLFVQVRHKRGMRPDRDLWDFWPPRRLRRANVGRCRCIQLLTGLAQAPDARGKLEMVCLSRLGSCEGLKPARESIKCEQILLGGTLNRL